MGPVDISVLLLLLTRMGWGFRFVVCSVQYVGGRRCGIL